MLDRWGRGLLNDWDVSKKFEPIGSPYQTYSSRTETWFFMSHLLLGNPEKQHEVQHDVESFVWLVLFHTLCYLKHNYTHGLGSFIDHIFESCHKENGMDFGGVGKAVTIIYHGPNSFTNTFAVKGNQPLTDWLHKAVYMVDEWVSFEKLEPGLVDDSQLTLYSHQRLEELFKTTLEKYDWPQEDDKCTYDLNTDSTVSIYESPLSSLKRKRTLIFSDASVIPQFKRAKAVSMTSETEGTVPPASEGEDNEV